MSRRSRHPVPASEGIKGHDVRSPGPSDSSDSGSDALNTVRGTAPDSGVGQDDGRGDTSDRAGTGERASADDDVRPDSDISPDRIVEAAQAGLGHGLDQAEEAQLGITDEEIEEQRRRKRRDED
jgi:hypothetical protein